METKMVTVDASAMAKDIAADGHVALYGILFDTDKTDIKPESAATIAEIAKFLKQDPEREALSSSATPTTSAATTTTWDCRSAAPPRSCRS